MVTHYNDNKQLIFFTENGLTYWYNPSNTDMYCIQLNILSKTRHGKMTNLQKKEIMKPQTTDLQVRVAVCIAFNLQGFADNMCSF
jgi:hypothetical protein